MNKYTSLFLILTHFIFLIRVIPVSALETTVQSYHPSPHGDFIKLRIPPSNLEFTLTCQADGKILNSTQDNHLQACFPSNAQWPVKWTPISTHNYLDWDSNGLTDINDIVNMYYVASFLGGPFHGYEGNILPGSVPQGDFNRDGNFSDSDWMNASDIVFGQGDTFTDIPPNYRGFFLDNSAAPDRPSLAIGGIEEEAKMVIGYNTPPHPAINWLLDWGNIWENTFPSRGLIVARSLLINTTEPKDPVRQLLIKNSNAEMRIEGSTSSSTLALNGAPFISFNGWSNAAPPLFPKILYAQGNVFFPSVMYFAGAINFESNNELSLGVAATPGDATLNMAGNMEATSYIVDSDQYSKQNIHPIPGALQKIAQLEAKRFVWKNGDEGEQDIGFLAQDVEKVFPEIVRSSSDEGLKSIEYFNLVAPMIEAIKEQQSQIKELRQELKSLVELKAQQEKSLPSLPQEF